MIPTSTVLFKRKIRSLPLCGRLAIFVSFILSFFTYGYLLYYGFFKNHTSEQSYLELEKCPLCYGKSLCNDLIANKAKLQGFSRLQFLNSLANLKNVNFGEYRGYPVVFKKLGHNAELDEFDSKYFTVKKLSFLTMSKLVTVNEIKGLSDFTKCPTERLIDKMLMRYKEMADAVDLSYPEKVQLVTTLIINPEPIILQTFPASEGWPFPKYFGSCGRYVVIENTGKPLADYYNAPWAERVNFALQIFKIAEQLTNNNVQFSLYLTDVCYDNFAVDSDGKVTVVDVENVLVVDKWQIERDKPSEWDVPDYSVFDHCNGPYGDCVSIHHDVLCTRAISDFNYYVVCRNMLSSYASEPGKPGGLLHDTPADINEKYNIDGLLNDCAKPSVPGGRLQNKDKLLKILADIKKEVF